MEEDGDGVDGAAGAGEAGPVGGGGERHAVPAPRMSDYYCNVDTRDTGPAIIKSHAV